MSRTFGPYSPIRQAGELFFVSGHVGVEPMTGKASTRVSAQTKQVLQNLSETLASYNLTLQDIVKTTVFLTDMDDFNEVNDMYVSHFNDPKPARSTIAVKELPRVANVTLKVEIEAVAMRPAS